MKTKVEAGAVRGGGVMIELTRLNGNPLFVNGDQIKWVEAAPDTMLTLMSGEKVVVRETCSEVVDRMIAFRVRLLRAAEFVPGDSAGKLAGGALHAAPPSVMVGSPGGADSAEVAERNRVDGTIGDRVELGAGGGARPLKSRAIG